MRLTLWIFSVPFLVLQVCISVYLSSLSLFVSVNPGIDGYIWLPLSAAVCVEALASSYVLCSPSIRALSGLLFYPRCFPLCWPNVFFFVFFSTCVLLTRPCTKVCVSPVVSVSPSCVNRCAPPCLAPCFLLLWCLFVLSGFLFYLIWTLWRMCVHIASPSVHVSLQTDWVARHKYNPVQHWKQQKWKQNMW